jgi:hypothetical protein
VKEYEINLGGETVRIHGNWKSPTEVFDWLEQKLRSAKARPPYFELQDSNGASVLVNMSKVTSIVEIVP